MPGATRETDDTCAGIVETPLQSDVYVNGKLWAVIGTPIASHPPCPVPPSHCSATMSEGSSSVYAGGIKVCRSGDI